MDAFQKVDDTVSKPVLGSDGAARWQDFRRKEGRATASQGVAPKAPLKASDRASGVSNWQEERERENAARREAGLSTKLEDKEGYTQFKNKGDEEGLSAKEKKRISQRIRPDKVDYFIPSKTFAGWKWDYIFTSRPESEGTGYYWDGMDSLLELKGERVRPRGKRKASQDNDTPSGENADPVDAAAATSKKKKKKSSKKEQVTLVQDPNHPLEQVATLLQQRQNALPPGWQSAKDPFTSKTYYYNAATGERTWTKPAATTATASANKDNSLPQGWTTATDPNTQKVYYYNTTTQETRWDRPTT